MNSNTTTPIASSGETVEQACIEFRRKHNYRVNGLSELDLFLAGANWQASQPTPPVDGSNIEEDTKQLLKKAFDAGQDFNGECNCGNCDYCLEFKGDGEPDFEKWYQDNKHSLRSSQQVSAVALLEKFVNACYTGCSKDELDLLRQEGEDILKLHNK